MRQKSWPTAGFANIGPGKIAWYDGHQEDGAGPGTLWPFVNDMEGQGRGDSYILLAKFLLDNRDHGSEYDQSHVPVQQQYEAVGHAVRANYTYSGMADIAAETGDMDYQKRRPLPLGQYGEQKILCYGRYRQRRDLRRIRPRLFPS